MTLEQRIRQRAENYFKKAARLNTEADYTQNIWRRVIDRDRAHVYKKVAYSLLAALRDAKDEKRPAGATNTDEPKG